MRTFPLAISISSILLSGAVFAAPTTQHELTASVARDLADTLDGTIKTVDAAKKTFTINNKDGDSEISITDSTVYMLDGKVSTFQDAVKNGRKATISHKGKVASKVEVVTST